MVTGTIYGIYGLFEERKWYIQMNKIQHISVGDIIKNEETAYDGFGSRDKITREYVVIDVYPYHVLTRDTKTGVKRSFSYGDLITLGIEH